ncbi:MAG TPA: hypothetical protein VFP93_00005 [Gammaproteobacteria bacterium]|nr:hypothetical protein [Gammaproteobacteria bacterium]
MKNYSLTLMLIVLNVPAYAEIPQLAPIKISRVKAPYFLEAISEDMKAFSIDNQKGKSKNQEQKVIDFETNDIDIGFIARNAALLRENMCSIIGDGEIELSLSGKSETGLIIVNSEIEAGIKVTFICNNEQF